MSNLQACLHNTHLRELCATYGVTANHFARRLRQVCPDIITKLEELHPKLNEKQLAQRYADAGKMVQHSMEYIQSIVFIDEAAVSEKPTADRVVARRGETRERQDSRLHPNKYEYDKIHYLLAVCGKLGLVDVEILSMTKGYKPDRQFYVSGWVGCALT